MDKAGLQSSVEERYKIMAQAEKVLLDLYMVTPLDTTTQRHLVKPWVKGWEGNSLDVHPTKLMSIEK